MLNWVPEDRSASVPTLEGPGSTPGLMNPAAGIFNAQTAFFVCIVEEELPVLLQVPIPDASYPAMIAFKVGNSPVDLVGLSDEGTW